VAVIDQDADAFRRLGPEFHGATVKGIGFDRKVLVSAGIKQADGFAAVSSGDNSNILAARVVRETYGINNVVARIYDQAAPRSTSDSASRRSRPCAGPQIRCCAGCSPKGPSRSGATRRDRSG
jgi:Trk K+ transport system NAD-binding subunit